MRKRNVSDELSLKEMKCHDVNQLALYLNTGTAKAREIGEEAGAIIRIGKRILFNVSKVNEYIDSISGE